MKLVMPPKEFPLAGILERVQKAVSQDPSWHPLKHFLKEQDTPDRRRGIIGIHPSDLSKECDRALAYSLVKAKRVRHELDPLTIRIFDHGHLLHTMVQGYLYEAKELGFIEDFQAEVPIHAPTIPLVGTMDGKLKVGGNWYAIEIKSAGPSTFYGSKNIATSKSIIGTARKWHRWQFHAYMLAAGIEAGFYIYYDKACDLVRCIWEPFNPDIWKAPRMAIEFANQMVDKKILPAKTKNNRYCPNCPYYDICEKDVGIVEADRRKA